MILTCPNCASRYVVDDAHVGPSGRTVRCSNCKTAWRAEASAAPLELAGVKELTEPARAADLPGEALPKQYRARVQQRVEARKAAAAGMVWGGMAAVLAGLLVLAVVFRSEVAQLWPKTASVYAGMGLRVNVVGLVIEEQVAAPIDENGRPAIRVTGAIRNVTDAAVRPPPLRVDLVDKSDASLVSRTLDLGGTELEAGRARPFSVTFYDPPASTDGSESTFLVGRHAPTPCPRRRRKPTRSCTAPSRMADPPRGAPLLSAEEVANRVSALADAIAPRGGRQHGRGLPAHRRVVVRR
jgi:predicted Zn finger-like uncharacterized protein